MVPSRPISARFLKRDINADFMMSPMAIRHNRAPNLRQSRVPNNTQ